MKIIKQLVLKDLYKLAIEKEYIKEDEISYKEFALVIKEFNKRISIAIMKGYKFNPHNNLGFFEVVMDKRRGKTINWGASNKRRQELIDNGLVPFSKEEAPNGEPWFIYYTDGIYYKWKWSQKKTLNFLKNSINWSFMVCTDNRKKLGRIVNENKDITDNYGTYRQNRIV